MQWPIMRALAAQVLPRCSGRAKEVEKGEEPGATDRVDESAAANEADRAEQGKEKGEEPGAADRRTDGEHGPGEAGAAAAGGPEEAAKGEEPGAANRGTDGEHGRGEAGAAAAGGPEEAAKG